MVGSDGGSDLTVDENLWLNAEFRLPDGLTRNDKLVFVERAIRVLGLQVRAAASEIVEIIPLRLVRRLLRTQVAIFHRAIPMCRLQTLLGVQGKRRYESNP